MLRRVEHSLFELQREQQQCSMKLDSLTVQSFPAGVHLAALREDTTMSLSAAELQHLPLPSILAPTTNAGSIRSVGVKSVGVPSEAIAPDNLRILVLPNGREIPYDKSIPLRDPPGKHFSQRLPELFKEWHESDLVRLNGHGIPVKHWDLVYKVRTLGISESGQWAAIRKEWGNWKVHTFHIVRDCICILSADCAVHC